MPLVNAQDVVEVGRQDLLSGARLESTATKFECLLAHYTSRYLEIYGGGTELVWMPFFVFANISEDKQRVWVFANADPETDECVCPADMPDNMHCKRCWADNVLMTHPNVTDIEWGRWGQWGQCEQVEFPVAANDDDRVATLKITLNALHSFSQACT